MCVRLEGDHLDWTFSFRITAGTSFKCARIAIGIYRKGIDRYGENVQVKKALEENSGSW